MLLTISTTHRPATDLGYLVAKNPARCQSFELSHGKAHVFYPEASEERCTVALLLDIDPVALVRGWRGPSGDGEGLLGRYVNDRPYVASSFLSVALGRVFGSAMKGTSKERAELAATPIPLEIELPVVPCRGGELFLRRLFEPLGYEVEAWRLALDERFPEWGESAYFAVRLRIGARLADVLTHLYVLLPVLDNEKHYWVGEDEIQNLLAKGEGWLAAHPERDQILHRSLRGQRRLTRMALERLLADEEPDLEAREEQAARTEDAGDERLSLNEERVAAVLAVVTETGARSVVDLGCGEGRLLRALLRQRSLARIVGLDVSPRALDIAADRLDLEKLPPAQRQRLELWQGSVTYRDARLAGFDAACAVEVIEHLELDRLPAFERVVFEHARPPCVVMTTPNAEYNVRFPGLPAGKLRHGDHRFEWTRAELEAWARGVAERRGYAVRFAAVGPIDPEVGAPTQMAVFTR
ncbi:MAG: 3' terminal RNA ribose 2'-O-methyltransferase Hen1 [Myxococcales bacterium]|nr:3' terminal RNA ribose 2'-O-methyltransferase Hen1 [Myxococcales bacterium]